MTHAKLGAFQWKEEEEKERGYEESRRVDVLVSAGLSPYVETLK